MVLNWQARSEGEPLHFLAKAHSHLLKRYYKCVGIIQVKDQYMANVVQSRGSGSLER